MPKTFEQYVGDYPTGLAGIADCLGRSYLRRLENIALRFAYSIEENLLDLKSGEEEIFLKTVLVKTTNELFGLTGCLKNGALNAAYHHPRAILEMVAAVEHIYCKPAKKDRKLKKFVKYPDVAAYLHYMEWKEKLDKQEIDLNTFINSCHVSEDRFLTFLQEIPTWREIWNLSDDTQFEIPNWHYSANIEGLFDSSETSRGLWGMYEKLCHLTHLSPLGERATGGHFLIGFPKKNNGKFNIKLVNRVITPAIFGAIELTRSLYQKANAGLIEGVLDWIPEQ